MQFTSISFEKLFPTGAYMNEKIRVDISLNLGDDPMEAINEARKLVNENFEKNNPHLVTPDIPIIPKKEHDSIYEQNKATEKAILELPLEKQIQSCNSKAVLKAVYEKIVKGKPELELVYNQKLKELSK